MNAAPTSRITFFGRFSLHTPQGDRTPSRRKEQALLAYLTFAAQPVTRDTLLGLLWPELSTTEARNNLRVALSRLRRRLPNTTPPLITATRQQIVFQPHPSVAVDVHTLNQLLSERVDGKETALHQWQIIETQYTADLLTGFYLEECAAFDEWLFVEREQLRIALMERLEQLGRVLVAAQCWAAATAVTRRLLISDPLHEVAHRQLMQLLAQQGQVAAALAHYEWCRQLLNDELNVEPAPETQAIAATLRQQRAGTAAQNRATPSNLPQTLTPFFGRKAEIADLETAIGDRNYRLFSLVGAGGMGKTRLAHEVAQRQLPHFAHGVFFVDLAGVDRADALPSAIASALGITHSEQLLNALRQRETLLLLDNFEQIVDGVHFVLKLLQQTERIVVLVTSRIQLNVQAEDIHRLHGLPLPKPDARLADATRSAAMRLFGDRMRRVDKRFRFSAENLPHVTAICQLVEGMPLGIELAAAVAAVQPLAHITQAIQADRDLLATTLHDVAPQHRSIRAVFNSSWRLLSQAEQQTLSRIALFRGGFTAEAARLLAGCESAELTRLSHKSLLRINRLTEGVRYDMHELLRQLALEQLADAPQFQQQHSSYYCTQLAATEPALYGKEPALAVRKLNRELDNIRQAWRFAVAQREFGRLAQTATAWMHFAAAQGLYEEVSDLFAELLNANPPQVDALPIMASRARLLFQRGHLEQSRLLAEAVVVADGVPAREVALAQLTLGEIAREVGEVESAETLLQTALSHAQQHSLDALAGTIMATHAYHLCVVSRYDECKAVASAALQLAKTLDHTRLQQRVQITLAIAASAQDQLEQTRRYAESALALTDLTRDHAIESRANNVIGWVARRTGDYAKSAKRHRRSLALSRDAGDLIQMMHAEFNLSLALHHLGQLKSAEEHAANVVATAKTFSLIEAEALGEYALGYVLLATVRPLQALAAFERCLVIYRQLGHRSSIVEHQIGAAAAAQQAGKHELAYEYVAAAATSLLAKPLEGVIDAQRTYAECYRMLCDYEDGRAARLITLVH